MVITCDASCNMGYIYLQPHISHIRESIDMRTIENYVDKLEIPYFPGGNAAINIGIGDIKVGDKTYRDLLNKKFS